MSFSTGLLCRHYLRRHAVQLSLLFLCMTDTGGIINVIYRIWKFTLRLVKRSEKRLTANVYPAIKMRFISSCCTISVAKFRLILALNPSWAKSQEIIRAIFRDGVHDQFFHRFSRQ